MTDYFVRSLSVGSGSSGGYVVGQVLRLIYELWGYCMNGSTSTTTPGGMPTTPTSGPTNGYEGTTVIATGSDGATTDGANTFDSATAAFDTTYIGKYLVTWKPGDPTSENGIYPITGVNSATQLLVEPAHGGIPDPSTLHPKFTTRTGVYYRVVDLYTVAQLVWSIDTHYLVIQFANPSSINVGQANSQVQFIIASPSSNNIKMVLSPGGTWTGSAFTDGSSAIAPTTNGSGWFNGSSYGEDNNFNLIADENSLWVHVNGGANNFNGGSGFQVEIPYRLYTQAQDPNPLCICVWGVESLRTYSSNSNYGGGWWMICPDSVTRNHLPITRSVKGISTDNYHDCVGFGNNLAANRVYNTSQGSAFTSPILLGHHKTTGQYTFARVQVRRARLSSYQLPPYRRLGSNGEWLHLQQGILVPWDNAILPFNLCQYTF